MFLLQLFRCRNKPRRTRALFQINIYINLNNMKQIMRRAKPNDMLTLELSDNKLKIKFKSNTTRTFSLPIIEIDEKEQKVPELSFPVGVTTDSIILSDSIDDADIVGDSVTFMAESKKFTVLAEGDLNRAQIEIVADEVTEIKASENAVKAKYSVEYLKKMVQGGKLADRVIINFNKDYPLKLSYISVDKVSLSFILAPRVEND